MIQLNHMPCRKCSQTGHNVRTCPQLINEQTIPSTTTTNQEITINDQSVDNTESTSVVEVDECPICMENINDTNRCITPCNHKFCLICMLKHSQIKNDCPTCRHKFNFTLRTSIPVNPIADTIIRPIRRRFIMTVINTTNQIIDISWLSQRMLRRADKFRKVSTVGSDAQMNQHIASNNDVFLFTPRNIIERYHRDTIPPIVISLEDFLATGYEWTPQDIIEQSDFYSKYVCSFCGNGNYIVHDNGVSFNNY